jgi:hypothetical protein
MKVVVMGHSHIGALRRAIPPDNDNYTLCNLNTDWPGLYRSGSVSQSILARFDPDSHFVSLLGGNYHNVFGLIEQPVHFDVFSLQLDLLDDTSERLLIPYWLLREQFERALRDRFLTPLRVFSEYFRGKSTHICSPPPISSAEHIATHSGAFRAGLSLGIAPAALRKKLYDLHSAIFRDFCQEHNILFMEPPIAAQDGGGYLKEAYWGKDPTHGNPAYGKLVFNQLEQLLGD